MNIQQENSTFTSDFFYKKEYTSNDLIVRTKEKKYWKELIRLLPESWLQKRTVTMNYENLLGMCSSGQRRHHKLNEWSGADRPELTSFIGWARELPYAEELLFQRTRSEELAEENARLRKELEAARKGN